MSYDTLIEEILSPAVKRLKDKRRELSGGGDKNSDVHGKSAVPLI